MHACIYKYVSICVYILYYPHTDVSLLVYVSICVCTYDDGINISVGMHLRIVIMSIYIYGSCMHLWLTYLQM